MRFAHDKAMYLHCTIAAQKNIRGIDVPTRLITSRYDGQSQFGELSARLTCDYCHESRDN
jgi:hypothetical protein